MGKKLAQRKHAKRRALERYDLALNRDDLRAWVKQIQEGQARKLEQQSLRVGKYVITHQGQEVVVIYDRHRKTIVTCLPPKEQDAD